MLTHTRLTTLGIGHQQHVVGPRLHGPNGLQVLGRAHDGGVEEALEPVQLVLVFHVLGPLQDGEVRGWWSAHVAWTGQRALRERLERQRVRERERINKLHLGVSVQLG